MVKVKQEEEESRRLEEETRMQTVVDEKDNKRKRDEQAHIQGTRSAGVAESNGVIESGDQQQQCFVQCYQATPDKGSWEEERGGKRPRGEERAGDGGMRGAAPDQERKAHSNPGGEGGGTGDPTQDEEHGLRAKDCERQQGQDRRFGFRH